MNTTWILVANRASARLFESNGPGKGPQLLKDVPIPKADSRITRWAATARGAHSTVTDRGVTP